MSRPLLLDDLIKSFLPSYTNSHPLYTSDNRDTLDSLIQRSQNRYDTSSGSNNLDSCNPSDQETVGINRNIFLTEPNFLERNSSLPQMDDLFHHLQSSYANKMKMLDPFSELNSSQFESQNQESVITNSSQFSMGASDCDVFSQQSYPSLQAYSSGLENIIKYRDAAMQKAGEANPPPPAPGSVPNVSYTPKSVMQGKGSIPWSPSVTSLQSSLSNASAPLSFKVDRDSLPDRSELILRLRNQLFVPEPEFQSSRSSVSIPGFPIGNSQPGMKHTDRTPGPKTLLVKRRPQRSWEVGDFSGILSNSSPQRSAPKDFVFNPSEIIVANNGYSRYSCDTTSKLMLGGSSGIDITQHPFLLSSLKKRRLDNRTTFF